MRGSSHVRPVKRVRWVRVIMGEGEVECRVMGWVKGGYRGVTGLQRGDRDNKGGGVTGVIQPFSTRELR